MKTYIPKSADVISGDSGPGTYFNKSVNVMIPVQENCQCHRWRSRSRKTYFNKSANVIAGDPGPGKLTLTNLIMSSLVIPVQENLH